MKRRLLLVMSLCLPCLPALAGGDEPHARAELIAEQDSAVAGQTLFIGLHLDIDEHWHVYWNGYNDSGYPIELNLEAPAGYEIGEVLWPAPERLVHADGEVLDHVFHDSVTLIVPITVPTEATPGESVTITGSADWLVCKKACIFESDDKLEITVPISGFTKRSSDAPHFDKTRDRLPEPIGRMDIVEAERIGDTLDVFSPGAMTIAFYPAQDCPPAINLIDDGQINGPRMKLRFEHDKAEHAPIRGVLEIFGRGTMGPNSRVYLIDLPAG